MQSAIITQQIGRWTFTLYAWLILVRARTDIVVTLVARYGINGSMLALIVMAFVVMANRSLQHPGH